MRAATRLARRDERPGVAFVDPRDGATGVFRDAPVALRISAPVDPRTVTAENFRVQDREGRVPGHAQASSDGRLLVWWPERLLRPDVLHFVVVRGLRDLRGRPVTPHCSRFVSCGLARQDLSD